MSLARVLTIYLDCPRCLPAISNVCLCTACGGGRCSSLQQSELISHDKIILCFVRRNTYDLFPNTQFHVILISTEQGMITVARK